jgi:voltage-gated potassium channel
VSNVSNPRATAGKDGQTLLDRFERATAWPMLLLSLAFITLLIVPSVSRLSQEAQVVIEDADWIIWAAFAVEYAIRLILSPSKLRFLRSNLLDLAVVALPLLRPLRIASSARALRLIRAARVMSVAARSHRIAHRIVNPRNVTAVLMLFILAVTGGALLAFEFERGAQGSNITTFGDALWWAVVTVTTVGYGDRYPVTPEGRGIATILMLVGLSVTGLLVATITTAFIGGSTEEVERHAEVIRRLERIEQALSEGKDLANPGS